MKFVFDVAQCQILIRRFALANTLIAGQATADGIGAEHVNEFETQGVKSLASG